MNNIRNSLAKLWPSARISLVLAFIAASLVLMADLFEVSPNHARYELEKRKQLSESLAVLFSVMITDSKIKKVRNVLSRVVQREEELLSAGFRTGTGKLLFDTGSHDFHWGGYKDEKSTSTHALVPIFAKKRQLGTIELRFRAFEPAAEGGIFRKPLYRLIMFVFVFGFLSFLVFMLRTLREIDPSSVIPDRVNAAFDTLSEGLVILDNKEQIILTNTAFCEIARRRTDELLGFRLSKLDWKSAYDDVGELSYPWLPAMSVGKRIVGEMLVLKTAPKDFRTLTVNCAPIMDHQDRQQGMLLTFDDVTELEVQRQELQVAVSNLELSQKEVQRQNKELHFLATRDPMTGCLNRRSFNELFAESFKQARIQDRQLSCIMVDIDHFKRVNDNYGHAVGDDVIKFLANTLLSSTRDEDIVSRYGGEEFCIILPGIDMDGAIAIAERIRLKVKDNSISTFASGPHITASLGVASILDHAKDPGELNEQADQALYAAKESGRNRVIGWSDNLDAEKTEAEQEVQADNPIFVLEPDRNAKEVEHLKRQIEQLERATSVVSEQLLHEQNYDRLTGLPNQALFYDRVTQAIERDVRKGLLTAVLIIEVDLFSQANNSFGAKVAESMFASLTKRMIDIFRKTDSISLFNANSDDLTVSKFDGEAFGVLLPDLEDRMNITWVVKRILGEMSQPVLHDGKSIGTTCKIGIGVFPDDAESTEELISHANTARAFMAAGTGGGHFQFYDSEMQKTSQKLLELEMEVNRAIKNKEWLLYYQPKLDVKNNRIRGVEALIRWNHPEKGVLAPFAFVDFAEERGMIIEIGSWVLRTACRQAKAWFDQGMDITVAINLSAIQLHQEKLSDHILEIIRETGVRPQQIELEVTETMLVSNLEMTVNTLNRLHCRGIKVSLDDFGTGYSSLEYLKRLPIDTLKIDRTFIKDIIDDRFDRNIVNAVISMAHGMDLQIVAEGVETQEQYDALKAMACDHLQGYFLGKPVAADNISELLKQNGCVGTADAMPAH